MGHVGSGLGPGSGGTPRAETSEGLVVVEMALMGLEMRRVRRTVGMMGRERCIFSENGWIVVVQGLVIWWIQYIPFGSEDVES